MDKNDSIYLILANNPHQKRIVLAAEYALRLFRNKKEKMMSYAITKAAREYNVKSNEIGKHLRSRRV